MQDNSFIRLSIDDFKEESKELVRNFICSACKFIILNPVVDECSHLYCEECLAQLKSCVVEHSHTYSKPIKMTPILEVKKLINQKLAYCKYRNRHCGWEGTYNDIIEHIKNDCKKHLIPCPNNGCEETILREDIFLHETKCKFQLEKCEFCNQSISSQGMKFHVCICLERSILCDQHCGTLVKRKNIGAHLEICAQSPVICPYSFLGCDKVAPQTELNKHIELSVSAHMEHMRLFCLSIYQDQSVEILLGKKKAESSKLVLNPTVKQNASDRKKQFSSNEKKESIFASREALVHKRILNAGSIMINKMEISKELIIKDSTVICSNAGSKMLFCFALLTLGETEVKWTITIHDIDGWIGIGVCNIDAVTRDYCKEFHLKSKSKHDSLILDSDGYIYQNLKERERYTYRAFQKGHEYSFIYRPCKNTLSVSLKDRPETYFEFNNVNIITGRIAPCAFFKDGSGEVSFENSI
jgi:hypothetical protein